MAGRASSAIMLCRRCLPNGAPRPCPSLTFPSSPAQVIVCTATNDDYVMYAWGEQVRKRAVSRARGSSHGAVRRRHCADVVLTRRLLLSQSGANKVGIKMV